VLSGDGQFAAFASSASVLHQDDNDAVSDVFRRTLPGNSGPAAAADTYMTVQNRPLTVAAPGVLANDTDPDGDPLSAVRISGPSHGTLELNANGSFTYAPTDGYAGPDRFEYRASDGTQSTDAVVVTITVRAAPPPTPPVPSPPPAPPSLPPAPARPSVEPLCLGRSATIAGTARRDVLRDTTGADVIVALGGNDVVRGAGGADRVCAGAGADRVQGGAGNDRLDGGPGNDRLTGGAGNDRINARDASPRPSGAAAATTVSTRTAPTRSSPANTVETDSSNQGIRLILY
jgi:hypothetical protein